MEELKGHLKDIAADKSELIIGCVQALSGQALQKATAEFNMKLEEATKEAARKEIACFQGYLVERSSTTTSADVEKFTMSEVATLLEEFLAQKGHAGANKQEVSLLKNIELG